MNEISDDEEFWKLKRKMLWMFTLKAKWEFGDEDDIDDYHIPEVEEGIEYFRTQNPVWNGL